MATLTDEARVPRILDVLGPPGVGEPLPLRTDGVAMLLRRRVQVEQRAVGVEDEDRGAHLVCPRIMLMIPEKSVLPSPEALNKP